MRYPILKIGLSGVDMRMRPLFLDYGKAAYAENLSFTEALVKSRSGLRYHKLGINGKWQGGSLYSPSEGLSAQNYVTTPNALVNVVDGKVYLSALVDGKVLPPHEIGGTNPSGEVYTYDAENYLIVNDAKGHTQWSNGGQQLEMSKGMQTEGYTETHDELGDNDNWLPHCATMGAYVHGRTHTVVPFSCNNSEVVVSDLIGKRGYLATDDLLKTEEHMNPAHGGGLTAPSRLGPVQAIEVMPEGSDNGEGDLFTFHRNGVARHNTLFDQRETRYDATGTKVTDGWDTRRITNIVLNKIGAIGRYAVSQLPNDILFRSKYGLHFLRVSLGQGTFNDETTNIVSIDVDPLMKDLKYANAASVGHWIEGNRFFATIEHDNTPVDVNGSAKAFVSLNQATTYTEDRTPIMRAEGVYRPSPEILAIHKFTSAGYDNLEDSFGFICSDNDGELYYAEFDDTLEGVDIKDDKELPIEWELVTGAFPFETFDTLKEIKDGYLDAITNETTEELTVEIRTDAHTSWEKWGEVECKFNGPTLVSGYNLTFPSKKVKEATWFQFRIRGKGYVELRTMDAEVVKTTKKLTGRGKCVKL